MQHIKFYTHYIPLRLTVFIYFSVLVVVFHLIFTFYFVFLIDSIFDITIGCDCRYIDDFQVCHVLAMRAHILISWKFVHFKSNAKRWILNEAGITSLNKLYTLRSLWIMIVDWQWQWVQNQRERERKNTHTNIGKRRLKINK